MVQLQFARPHCGIHALHFNGLISSFFVGITVLFKASNTIRYLGSSQARQQGTSLDAANMHDRWIKSL
jgi:hypothetical protein